MLRINCLRLVRNAVFAGLFLVLSMASCQRAHDPFFGRWTVERVNVAFDEGISTPEMVRQYGELEKGNILEIGRDSVLVFVSDGDTLRGSCSLRGTLLLCNGKPFGVYDHARIETETVTSIGKIKVTYSKE